MKRVAKFGGSSLASAKQFKKAGDIIRFDKSRRYVIPSVPGKRNDKDKKVTDMLYQCYEAASIDGAYKKILEKIKSRYEEIIDGLELNLNLTHELETIEENFVSKAERDYATSRREYSNGLVITEYLGFKFVDVADVVFFHEDGSFDAEATSRELGERLESVERAAIPGFYGATADGTVKTFSRGGSDVTSSLVARAIHTDMYESWTDVSGFLAADPRIVKNPEVIETIAYRELQELVYMGASMLYGDAIFPVRKEGIPINIHNTNKPGDKGTLIMESTCRKPRYTTTGIAGRKGFCSISIEKAMMNAEVGFGRKVLEVFKKYSISFEYIPSGIDMMTVLVHQSEFEEYGQSVIAGIHRLVKPDFVEPESDLALIAVVGRGMKATREIAGRVFSALTHARINVKMIDQSSSELDIIIGVKNSDFEQAIKAVYDIFIMTEL